MGTWPSIDFLCTLALAFFCAACREKVSFITVRCIGQKPDPALIKAENTFVHPVPFKLKDSSSHL